METHLIYSLMNECTGTVKAGRWCRRHSEQAFVSWHKDKCCHVWCSTHLILMWQGIPWSHEERLKCTELQRPYIYRWWKTNTGKIINQKWKYRKSNECYIQILKSQRKTLTRLWKLNRTEKLKVQQRNHKTHKGAATKGELLTHNWTKLLNPTLGPALSECHSVADSKTTTPSVVICHVLRPTATFCLHTRKRTALVFQTVIHSINYWRQ